MTKLIVNNQTNGKVQNHRALAVVSQVMQQELETPTPDSTVANLEGVAVTKQTETEYTVEVDHE
jgi:antitoxin component HigA of HigAB toxin-antitoxin module